MGEAKVALCTSFSSSQASLGKAKKVRDVGSELLAGQDLVRSLFIQAFFRRIPGLETDRLVHLDDSTHVVVLHAGRFFRMACYSEGKLLRPREMQT